MKRKKAKYQSDLARKMYAYFVSYDGIGAPSLSKFARSVGITLSDLEGFLTRKTFMYCYNECSEIRRDYLIDNALTKKFDSSFVKFLLDYEKDDEHSEENRLDLNLTVI